MSEVKLLQERTVYCVFIGLAAILIAMALFFSPSAGELFSGYAYILTHPALIDFDGLAHVGHYGSAFLNSGLCLLGVLLVYKLTKTGIQGPQIAAAMMVVGFAFYGKDILNIWWPVIGIFIHARREGKPLSSVTAMAFFCTCLAPVFSVTAFGTTNLGYGSPLAWIMGMVFGIFAGWLVAVIAAHLLVLHKGYILFNIGFAAGIVGVLIHALRSSLNIGHEQLIYEVDHYVTGANFTLGATLVIIFVYFMVMGLLLGGSGGAKEILRYRSKGGNYVEKFGHAPCFINMGVLGLMATAYVFFADILVEGHLGGHVFAAIFAASAFAANGLTIRTHLPTMLGVFLAAFVTGGIAGLVIGDSFLLSAITKVGTRGMLASAIFSCGMAPIPGEHGFKAGVFVGIAHGILVPYVGAFHGWMSLYNNGLGLALIATFLYPIYAKWSIKEKEKVAIPA